MGARGPKSDLREQVLQLASEAAYQLPDGSPNRSAIARELRCTRQAVQKVFARLPPNPTTPSGKVGHSGSN